jgi:hypothetical protein
LTSLFPPGAGGGDPKGPIREPLHPDERAGRPPPGSAPPPSERGTLEPAHRGVGVFRLAGWGWGVSIALVLLVGVVILVGYLRDDPGRNPAPIAYRTAVCAAVAELGAGAVALERGVEQRSNQAARDAARREIEARVAAANAALTELPEWTPGRALDELMGAQIITLTNGAAALESGPVEEDLEAARAVDASAREAVSDGRYGFTCEGGAPSEVDGTSSSSHSTPLSARG